MNKYKEALQHIKDNTLCSFYDKDENYMTSGTINKSSLGLLQELVDKATPKKPFGYHTHYNCPSCQRRVRSGKGSSSSIRDTVCRSCYQVLDWSKDDE